MRASTVVTVLAAAAVGGAVLWWHSRPEVQGGAVQQPRHEPTTVAPSNTATRAVPERAGDAADVRFAGTSYYDQFLSSNDLFAFAALMHRLAVDGDDAAQYWLFRALHRCGFLYDQAFQVQAGPAAHGQLTVDEAVQREIAAPWIGALEIHRLHEQCARLRASDADRFGAAAGWLNKASASGYPLAQIWKARELADGGRERAQARALTLAALQSGDPDVIRQTETVAPLLVQGESARERHQWLWTIAGCRRGARCGPDADWVRAECARDRRCQPHEGGLDIVRRQTGPQYMELEEAAEELAGKIHAQKWDELGL
jgi:hypothetical protein